MQDMGPAGAIATDVEGDRKGTRVKAPRPGGVRGREGDGSGPGFLTGYKGRVYGVDCAPRGGGGGDRGRTEPPLNVLFLPFLLYIFPLSFLCSFGILLLRADPGEGGGARI